MPNDYYPINPEPYPVRVPNGTYDQSTSQYRVELWDNKAVWRTTRAEIDANTVANPPSGPVVGVPAWGTFPDLPDPPTPWSP